MNRIGSATSAVQFMRQIGATMGVAFLGTVLASALSDHLKAAFPQGAAGAPVLAQGGEGMALDLDREFARLEDLLARALRGDEAAYRALLQDPMVPKAYLQGLSPGGLPARFAALKEEVRAALDRPDEQFERGPLSGVRRGTRHDHGPAFVVEDGRYLSARWPGDAYLFAERFDALLGS